MSHPRKQFRITPFGCLMLFFTILLIVGIITIIAGLQPPAITTQLPYNA